MSAGLSRGLRPRRDASSGLYVLASWPIESRQSLKDQESLDVKVAVMSRRAPRSSYTGYVWARYWARFTTQRVDDPVERRHETWRARFRRQQVDDPVGDGHGGSEQGSPSRP